MPTNPGQGNSQGPPYATGQYTNVYVYSGVVSPVVGTQLYANSTQGATAPAGTYKIFVDNLWKTFTVNTGGVVTAVNTCSWSSVQYYSASVSGTKNNCSIGSCTTVSGSTVNLNDGNPANAYSGQGTATSFVSQADADAQAYQQAIANFDAGKQAKINELGYCTWTYNNGSGSYNTNFTRNNCGSNCYGTSVNYGNSQSGYSAQSTVSCQDAIDTANNAAYQAAVNYVNANGQNHANANGSCCCWNLEYYCSGCQRRSRERNSCTNELRNDSFVADNSCDCGQTCQGTYDSFYCVGTTRYKIPKYTCNNANAGTETLVATCSTACGANTSPNYESQGYNTCYSCNSVTVYKDTGACSPTNGAYFVYYNGSYVQRPGQPTGGGCYYDSNCVDSGSPYCSGNNWVINQTQSNPCSGASCGVRVIEYNSTANGCYTPPSCNLYELYMYGGYSEFVYVQYSVCGGGVSTLSAYNDGGGGYGGQICAVAGTAYITSGSGALIDLGSCNT